MKKLGLGICAGAAALLAAPASADLKLSGEPVGDWYIYSEADAMTDELSCVAYYKDGKFIQLTDDSLAVAYRGRGGIKGYQLRFDEGAPTSMQLPSRSEERIGALILRGKTFDQVLAANRLRVQGVTVLNSIENDDIDLTDANAAIGQMQTMSCK